VQYNINNRMRYTRQTIVTNTFYQMPRFLTAGEFAGGKMSNNARILYTLLLDRHRISVKNGWFDENGEVYIYFKREEMEAQLGLSERTVAKIVLELKTLFLVEEKQQGLNKPNKIYLLSPAIGNDENPDPYVDPAPDYNPEKGHDYSYDTEPEISTLSDTQHLPPRTRNNYVSEPVKNATPEPVNSTGQNPQELRPNDNKLINNENNHNKMSDNEGSETAAALGGDGGGEPPDHYSQILDLYNGLCGTHGLRPIRAINGKRKTQTAARFKEYGLSGFFDLFGKVAASIFLCGGGDRGWKADFDWLIDPANMQKVLEGKYDNDQSNTPLPPSATGQDFLYYGTAEIPINPVIEGQSDVALRRLLYDPHQNYRNKNGFNTMAALQQMLDAEAAPDIPINSEGVPT